MFVVENMHLLGNFLVSDYCLMMEYSHKVVIQWDSDIST